METIAGYKKLIAWQKSDELAIKIYQATINFPKSEQFSLSSQLRRAALSVPTNIVEGYARNSRSELKRFLIIALGSLAEVKYLLDFAKRQRYIKEDVFNEIMNLSESCGQLLWRLNKSIVVKK